MNIKKKTIGGYSGLLAGILALITLVIYWNFSMSNNMFNSEIFLFLLFGCACEAICLIKEISILPIVSTVCFAIAFVGMITDGLPTFIDAFNGIAMFGGTGQVGLVTALMVMMFGCSLLEIISSFTQRNRE